MRASTPTILVERDYGLGGRAQAMVGIDFCLMFLALFAVVNRWFANVYGGRKKGIVVDTYLITASLAFCIPMDVLNIVAVNFGYGRPSYILPEDDRVMALKLSFLVKVFYKISINLTKMSILLFYHRIFNTQPFTCICKLVFGYVSLFGTAAIFATIFECSPIAHAYDESVEGHCVDLTFFWYFNAGSNIVTSLIILVLPFQKLYQLRMSHRNAYWLTIVFLLAILVCSTSGMCMQALYMSFNSNDKSAGTMFYNLWTTVEANLALICACLPMVHTTLSALFPDTFPTFRSGCAQWIGTRVPTPVRTNTKKAKPKYPKKTTLHVDLLDLADNDNANNANNV